MSILVTGGNGYLGGRIVEYLTQKGFSVKVGDRSIFLTDNSLDFSCKGVVAIIHLAAMNAYSSSENPKSALLVNGLNTLRLLRSAERMGVSKFIYFSTAHVYKSPLSGTLNEEVAPRPTHHYSITHRLSEDYVLEADSRGKILGIVFRLTNAVGPPIRKSTNCWMLVANNLCRQVVTDREIILHSNALIERDCIPISSVNSAVHFALTCDKLNSDIFNLSSGYSYTLGGLAELISNRAKKILKLNPKVIFNKNNTLKDKDYSPLRVSNKKLKSHGFLVKADISNEIEQLLIKCNLWF